MAFELNPVFHTETMVKILKSQGHLLYAVKVCEKVLERDPLHPRLGDELRKIKSGLFRFEPAGLEKKSPDLTLVETASITPEPSSPLLSS